MVIHIQESRSNLVDILRRRAEEDAQETVFTFLLDGESQIKTMSYVKLDAHARAIAAKLQARVSAGDRALLLFPPCLDYISAFWGCLYAGVIAVPTYPPDPTRMQRSMPRFLSILEDAEPHIALTTQGVAQLVQGLAPQFPPLERLDWLSVDDIPDLVADDWKPQFVQDDSLAFLQFTSGSTSNPKGVMLTHGNLVHNSAMIYEAFRPGPGQTYVSWLPFYHDMGLIGGIIQPIIAGGEMILMSPLHFLQRPYRWLKTISDKKARVSGGPNFAYDLCVRKVSDEQLQSLDLRNWEIAFNGSEAVRASTLERFTQTFAPCGFESRAFYPCYGLAEATLFVSGGDVDTPPKIFSASEIELKQGRLRKSNSEEQGVLQIVSCGRARLDQVVQIVDPETTLVCEEGKIGEIWVAGPSVAMGYWRQQDATEHTFRYSPEDSTKGGFLRTGDLGAIRDGELYITGRIKDLIIIDGLNHYPQDIELTAERCHPAIRPGCCVAFSATVNGDEALIIVAEVVPRERLQAIEREQGGDVSEDVLRHGIRRAISLTHDLRVHDVVLIQAGSLQKTSSGKLMRNATREQYLAGSFIRWEKGGVARR